MPINVRANVVDIRRDTPRSDDAFLIDTNVWYCMFYSRAAMVPRSETLASHYGTFLNNAIIATANLHNCALSLEELAHSVERSELKIYNRTHAEIKLKAFRHNYQNERNEVVAEIKSIWCQIDGMSDTVSLEVDAGAAQDALSAFQTYPLDGYDLFILQSMDKHGIGQLLSDDSDFASIPDIDLFTANDRVINAAKDQDKLIRR